MAELGAKARSQLPDAAFAYIDSSGRRLLPIHDEAHVRNALARFNRVLFEDDAARDRARNRLLRAAKRHGIVPVGFIDGQIRPERRLPTGRVGLLYADIEDSTGHLAVLGDAYPRVISDLRRILRRTVRARDGREVDARADEYFAAFDDPANALRAATDAQRAIDAHAWPGGRPIRVRMGVHVGRPTLTPGGYVGLAVNTVARVADAGHGGQVLVTGALRDLVELTEDVELASLGRHRLRGLPDELEILQVAAEGLPTAFPPLRLTPPA
jgi:class 3 adenylate cyclase